MVSVAPAMRRTDTTTADRNCSAEEYRRSRSGAIAFAEISSRCRPRESRLTRRRASSRRGSSALPLSMATTNAPSPKTSARASTSPSAPTSDPDPIDPPPRLTSATRTRRRPSGPLLSRMFDGRMSPCRTPARWTSATPAATSAVSSATSGGRRAPRRCRSSARVPRSARLRATYGHPLDDCPMSYTVATRGEAHRRSSRASSRKRSRASGSAATDSLRILRPSSPRPRVTLRAHGW